MSHSANPGLAELSAWSRRLAKRRSELSAASRAAVARAEAGKAQAQASVRWVNLCRELALLRRT